MKIFCHPHISMHLFFFVAVTGLILSATPGDASRSLGSACSRDRHCSSNKCIWLKCRCDSDLHCGSGKVCDEAKTIHHCRDKRLPGQSCDTDAQCDHGCYNGTCNCRYASECGHLGFHNPGCSLLEASSGSKVCNDRSAKRGEPCIWDSQCVGGYCKRTGFFGTGPKLCCSDVSGKTRCDTE